MVRIYIIYDCGNIDFFPLLFPLFPPRGEDLAPAYALAHWHTSLGHCPLTAMHMPAKYPGPDRLHVTKYFAQAKETWVISQQWLPGPPVRDYPPLRERREQPPMDHPQQFTDHLHLRPSTIAILHHTQNINTIHDKIRKITILAQSCKFLTNLNQQTNQLLQSLNRLNFQPQNKYY